MSKSNKLQFQLYKDVISHGEINSGELMVDDSDYISIEEQVNRMMQAGVYQNKFFSNYFHIFTKQDVLDFSHPVIYRIDDMNEFQELYISKLKEIFDKRIKNNKKDSSQDSNLKKEEKNEGQNIDNTGNNSSIGQDFQ